MDAVNPVGALAVREVADDIEGGPGVPALIAQDPVIGEIAEEGIEGCRSAGEQGDGMVQSKGIKSSEIL